VVNAAANSIVKAVRENAGRSIPWGMSRLSKPGSRRIRRKNLTAVRRWDDFLRTPDSPLESAGGTAPTSKDLPGFEFRTPAGLRQIEL
jgi:hypothetical protein